MSVTVDLGHAEAHFSDLLARVEQGEEIVIARGGTAVARLTAVERPRSEADVQAAIEELLASRVGRPRTTAAEIREWINEGRR